LVHTAGDEIDDHIDSARKGHSRKTSSLAGSVVQTKETHHMKIQSDRSQIVDEREPVAMTAAPVAGEGAFAPPPPVPVAGVATGTETVLTARTSGFTPGVLVAGVVAIVLLVLGGITVARAGIDSSLDQPVVEVAGYTGTALLGLIELVFGLLLLIAALSRANRAILFLGIAGGVMALVAVFQPSVGEGSLAIERGFAVVAAIVMGIVVAAALLPTLRRRRVVRRTSDVT
jgi:hypothetical protein